MDESNKELIAANSDGDAKDGPGHECFIFCVLDYCARWRTPSRCEDCEGVSRGTWGTFTDNNGPIGEK